MAQQQQRHLPQETGADYTSQQRYDAAMQQKVIALALRLQQEHRETLTAAQIEEAAEEVGLEPEFVRRAIAEISAEPTAQKAAKARKPAARQPPVPTQSELAPSLAWTLLGGFIYLTAARQSPVPTQSELAPSLVWTLLGGFIYFFVKGWWKAGLAAMLLNFVTGGLSWFVLPFFAQQFVETVETWNAESGSGEAARTAASLQHLADLYAKGLISDTEYQTKRTELLSRL